ncbi:MAG TPA: hypothetical protein VFZ65_18095 [Planctomycetota bacterium]|nr:hypothetical protein [Planctomycetota bacterium]
MHAHTAPLVAALALAGLAAAQAPSMPPVPLDAIFPTPIHGAPADPEFGPYGHWSSGRDYKVSFGQQVVFYPRLGAGHAAHLPLAWRTESIASGGAIWRRFEAEAEITWNEHEWRLLRGDVVERWETRRDGVEQSFVLHERPAAGRDVVILGAVATPLAAAVRDPRHAPLDFCDARGEPVVRYGEAFAIDANGDRVAVATSWDGAVIGLVVPGEWLASAAMPVVVDPLLTRVSFGTAFNSAGVQSTDTVSALYRNDPHTICCVYSRLFTDNDIDAYGLMCNATFTNVVTIWQDLPTYDTLLPHCAYNSPADKWVIAFERRSTTSGVRTYTHARSSTTTGSGTLSFLAGVGGYSNRRPDVGGVYFQGGVASVLLVFEQESNTNTSDATVKAAPLDCTNGVIGTAWNLDYPFPPYEQRAPSIVSFAKGTTFAVAWYRATSPVDYGIDAVRTGFTGPLGLGISVDAGPGFDAVSPRIDGDPNGHVLIAFTARNQITFASRVDYALFDWTNPSVPVALRQATVAGGTLLSPVVLDGVAYDIDTRSHHTIVHHRGSAVTATRVGFTGGIVEQGAIATTGNAVAGSVGYLHATGTTGMQGRYPIFFADSAVGQPIWGSAMTYPTTQITATGTGCHGALLHGGAVPQPYAGNGNFGVQADGLPAAALAVWVAAFGLGSLPIPGAPGCTLQVDPTTMYLLAPQLASLAGIVQLAVPLPDDPVWTGDLYLQCAWLQGGLNPLGLGVTNGLLVPVR